MTKPAREEVLRKIRSALKRDDSHDSPRSQQSPAKEPERIAEVTLQREMLIEQFETELARVGGHFYYAHDSEAACDYVEKLASERGARSVVSWSEPVINELGLRERLESAGVQVISDDSNSTSEEFIGCSLRAGLGITGVDYALADTGTLVLLTGEGRARSASLVAPVHIAIMKPQQMLSGLNELMPLLDEKTARVGRDMPSAVTFITGPSRTADIELTLVVGVHGPQVLHVILLT